MGDPCTKGWSPMAAQSKDDVRRFRPGHPPGGPKLHHVVEVDADDKPRWEDGNLARALCGSDVSSVEHRPLWKASGEPCRHCMKLLRDIQAAGS